MAEYTRLETTPEVWAVLRARHHKDMEVYATYSAPDGDQFGDPTIARMETVYSIRGVPFIEAKTTWDAGSLDRKNEAHHYWLCIAKETTQ